MRRARSVVCAHVPIFGNVVTFDDAKRDRPKVAINSCLCKGRDVVGHSAGHHVLCVPCKSGGENMVMEIGGQAGVAYDE
jgi:hypothetical protein